MLKHNEIYARSSTFPSKRMSLLYLIRESLEYSLSHQQMEANNKKAQSILCQVFPYSSIMNCSLLFIKRGKHSTAIFCKNEKKTFCSVTLLGFARNNNYWWPKCSNLVIITCMSPDQKKRENNDCTTLGFIRRL